jgi:RHS repeat-associated protein
MQATDKAGNTTSQTWRVDNGPAGTVATTHDAEGNLLTDGRYTYAWDAKNRMTSVTLGADTWSFQYDGQNRRIAESKNGQAVRTWVWNKTQIVEERSVADGAKQRRWTGGVELLDSTNQSTGKRLLITDHLGSTRTAVDGPTGTTTASYTFTPWGKRSRIAGTEDLSSGYTGHLWHESGLSLAVYRPYDPEKGRWPSKDPIEELGGQNLYNYVGGNTFSRTDYKGLCWGNEAALAHYFSGAGGTVSLAHIGCLGELTTATQSKREEFKDMVRKQAHNIAKALSCPNNTRTHFSRSRSVGVHSGIFWIGGISLSQSANCNIRLSCNKPCGYVINCRISNGMSDPFEYPFDLDNSKSDPWDTWEPGTPFTVTGRWNDMINDTGRL